MQDESKLEQVVWQVEAGLRALEPQQCRAAVLVPLVEGENGPEILFEVRAAHLKRQPGEVCLPGGHIEPSEDARKAAIRETCEELLVEPGQLGSVTDLGAFAGPGGMPVRLFTGVLRHYDGSYDPSEVGSVFAVPLSWFRDNEPTVYRGTLVLDPPEDLPWNLIPGGHGYPWHKHVHEIPFYHGTNPIIWGFTARVIRRFVELFDAGLNRGL